MKLRLRLKSGVDITGFSATNQIILKELKKYGIMVADNGADWFFFGLPDSRWNDDDLAQLGQITGGDFKAVDTGQIEQ